MNAITKIACTTNCMLLIYCKSSTICSSSGILIINNGENVLLKEFALVQSNNQNKNFLNIYVMHNCGKSCQSYSPMWPLHATLYL